MAGCKHGARGLTPFACRNCPLRKAREAKARPLQPQPVKAAALTDTETALPPVPKSRPRPAPVRAQRAASGPPSPGLAYLRMLDQRAAQAAKPPPPPAASPLDHAAAAVEAALAEGQGARDVASAAVAGWARARKKAGPA